MPWTASDGPHRHTKRANSPAKRKKWAAVANAVLKKSGNEGQAIRIANAMVKRKKHYISK